MQRYDGAVLQPSPSALCRNPPSATPARALHRKAPRAKVNGEKAGSYAARRGDPSRYVAGGHPVSDPTALAELERQIRQFSREEQLWLIERLAHGLRENPGPATRPSDAALNAMAVDQDVQRELRAIESDLAGTEGDGLGLS